MTNCPDVYAQISNLIEQREPAILEVLNEMFDQTDTMERSESAEINMTTQRYSTIKIKDKRKQVCCICMDNFSCNQEVYWLSCKHIFHKDCLSEWIRYKPECPTCRSSVDLK